MIDEQLAAVICRELGLAPFQIEETALASDLPGWDSLNHARVLASIEKAFGIRFRVAEILSFRNLGDLQAAVRSKIEGAPPPR
jgi:acyl carrier protein